MGNQKQKWTTEEEVALQTGVAKHGPGKWKNILTDPEFAPFLTHRSNIDLKDKWRNLSVSNSGQGSKERPRNAKPKALPPPPVSSVKSQTPLPGPSRHLAVVSVTVADDSPLTKQEGKEPPGNYAIFDALSTIKDPNGSDVNAISKFIEQKYGLSNNFRKHLGTKLKRLVATGKLEKVHNSYKLKNENSMGLGKRRSKTKHKDVRAGPIQIPTPTTTYGKAMEACDVAAKLVALAEEKTVVAAEAAYNFLKISNLADETISKLQLFKEIYEHCSRGEIFLLA